jgi:uncharacterized repeat protein (TIGR01451 family)
LQSAWFAPQFRALSGGIIGRRIEALQGPFPLRALPRKAGEGWGGGMDGNSVLRRGISRTSFRKLLKVIAFSTAMALASSPPRLTAQESIDADIETELVAEVRENVSRAPGTEVYRFVPAKLLQQGEVVYYTVRVKNAGSTFARDVIITQRIPVNTTYVEDSASGPGANVTFSVDGGQTFAPATALTIDVEGNTQPAEPAHYTHIRWHLRNPLAPGAIALARFRAVFR